MQLASLLSLAALLATGALSAPVDRRGAIPAPNNPIVPDIGTSIARRGSGGVHGNAELTHYDQTAGIGACGVMSKATDLVAAMPHGLFDAKTPAGNPNKNPLCGKKLKVKGPGGKSVQVTVVDRCPGCKGNSLDLSPPAFKALADLGVGRIKGASWTMAA